MEAKFTRKSMVYRRIGMEHSANCLRRRLPPIHRQKPPLDGLPGGDRDHDDCWISLSRENATQSPRFAYLPRVRNHSSCLQNVNCFCAGPYSPKR